MKKSWEISIADKNIKSLWEDYQSSLQHPEDSPKWGGEKEKEKKFHTPHQILQRCSWQLDAKIGYIGIEFNCMGTRNPWEKPK